MHQNGPPPEPVVLGEQHIFPPPALGLNIWTGGADTSDDHRTLVE